jgi:starch-binding outer membrane protein, SusD/RagB family
MKKINFLKYGLLSTFIGLGVSCTNLEEASLEGDLSVDKETGASNLTAGQVTAALQGVYEGLRDFQGQGQQFGMGELSTDAMAGPTRGGDWDDNAKWRELHTLTYGSDNSEIANAYTSLLGNVYNCNQIITSTNATATQIAEARFLRAFYYYHVVDLFGKAPYKDFSNPDPKAKPSVWTSAEATNFIITELEAIVGSLPAKVSGATPEKATKDAANFLLAKIYLNKAVFTDEDRIGPFTFAASDMNKVVQYVDAIVANGANALAGDYWDNFSPSNGEDSDELIFTSKNTQAGAGGGIQSRWRMGTHYNTTPGGWNGFVILNEFYASFDPTDRRIYNYDAAIKTNFGNPVGIQVGQQYQPGGSTKVKDRLGNDLAFKPITDLIASGPDIEMLGYRPMKYVPDNANLNQPDNDYVFFRLADALLMKAEAIFRGGTGSNGTLAADLAARALPAVVTIDLASEAGLLKARGQELWLEGWRRNDLVRFGKFLEPNSLKPFVSPAKCVLFPIPADALLNPNMTQNPGY